MTTQQQQEKDAQVTAKIVDWANKAKQSFDTNRGTRSLALALAGAGLGMAGSPLLTNDKVDKYDLLLNALAGGAIGSGVGTLMSNKKVK